MANWHYYNTDGEKISVTDKELKELALTGKITRGTFVEEPGGRTGLAKDVRGLKFAEAVQSKPTPESIPSEPKPLPPVPIPQVEAKPSKPSMPIAAEQVETSDDFEYFDDDDNNGDYYDDYGGDHFDDYGGEPSTSGGGWYDELKAIREEPNQARKQELLRAVQARYGITVDNLTKRWIGIRGF